MIAKGIAENNNINGSDSACSANSFLIGDGVCDEVTNNEKCLFDSGDCCRQDAESKKYCTSCLCDFAGIQSQSALKLPISFTIP